MKQTKQQITIERDEYKRLLEEAWNRRLEIDVCSEGNNWFKSVGNALGKISKYKVILKISTTIKSSDFCDTNDIYNRLDCETFKTKLDNLDLELTVDEVSYVEEI